MGSGKRLPDEDHVARYCSGGRLDGERPLPNAFGDNNGISVNHLEWFDQADVSSNVRELQKHKLQQRNFTTRRTGRFAVLTVGDVHRVGPEVVADPACDDPSHALIRRGATDQVRVRLALLARGSVYPALP